MLQTVGTAFIVMVLSLLLIIGTEIQYSDS